MYIVKVLCVSRRWDDVRPFLDSCPGLSESVRDAMAQKVAAYRHKLEEAEADCIEILESERNDRSDSSASCQIDTINGN